MPVIDEQMFLEQLEEDQESWKAPHAQAMECFDLEDLLRLGLRLYQWIQAQDETWSRKVQNGEAKFDEAMARKIRARYEWWITPCDAVLAWVEKMEREYRVPEGAREFKEARLRVNALLRIPIDRLVSSMKRTRVA